MIKNHPEKLPGLFGLFRIDYFRLKNNLKQNDFIQWIQIGGLFLISVFFIFAEFEIASKLFKHIMLQTHLKELRFILLSKLLYMVFIIFTILLIYSNIVMAISTFFLSAEIDLLHARPVKLSTIFTYRFFETFIGSSWMFLAFGVPILLAYGTTLELRKIFLIQLFNAVLPLLIISSCLGVMVAILLILFFSPRRAQRALLLVGIALSAGLVLVFRWMKPEQLIDPIGLEQMTFYIDTLRMPMISWLPTTWATETLILLVEERFKDSFLNSLYLWLFACVCMVITKWIFNRFWFSARSGGKGTELVTKRIAKGELKPNKPFYMGLFYKDWLLFVRDASQWSQIIVIAALVAIYIFNFKNLPYQLYGMQYSMSFVSVAASGLILSALLARFAYPSVSIEGKSFWILASSPVSWSRFLWLKFAFYFFPAAIIGGILIIFSLIVLDVPQALLYRCSFLTLLITVGCSGMAVGWGAIRPRFDLEDPARIAVSSGGFVYMLFSLTYICSLIFISLIPDLVFYFSIYWSGLRFLKYINPSISLIVSILFSLSVTMIPMKKGIKHLQNL